jgi:[acyl-carrier-protein] S-malonyltransferase
LNQPSSAAYVFPGQGAQWVGMGKDLYQQYAPARELFDLADATLRFSLSRLCFEGPEDELKQTENAQPAIVAVSLATLAVLKERKGSLPQPAFVAGHSLGEYTALAAAGVLDAAATIRLAWERGRLMHQAGQLNPGGMAAVIGLSQPQVADLCTETGTKIANINCPGQLVISGAADKLARAVELAEERGAFRVVPLQVSGAFHTALMQPAVDDMAEIIASLDFNPPQVPIIANTSAQPLTTAADVREELLRQLTNRVRWQASVEYMLSNGVDTFIEIGPGRVLSGLIRRISKAANTVNIGDARAVNGFVIQRDAFDGFNR